MATTTPNVAQMQTEARSRQMADELAAAASIAQPPASKTVFPADNDAALQALINESKEKSLEYQRLQNEEDRQQWEKETAANLRWKQRLDEQRQDRRTLDQAQDQVVRDNRVMGLLAKAGEIDARLTAASQNGPLTEWTAPLDLLRERV